MSADIVSEGPVYSPETAGYEEELAAYQTGFRQQPEMVVGATGPDDVRAAVRLAARRGLPLAVQATGHGLPGDRIGGVLVTTKRMRGVDIDHVRGIARIQAGTPWEDVIRKAARHGMAPLSGSAVGVGAVGYTLEGGIGLLARTYGFAADRITAAEIVTADGELRHVTAESDPDLFWALRGAGANFGVVTSLDVELVGQPRIYGGGLYFTEQHVPDALHAWLDWTVGLGEETTSSIGLVPFPDKPAVPAPVRGRYTAHIRIVHTGSASQGAEVVEPLGVIGPCALNTLTEMPYTDADAIYRDPPTPMAYYGTNVLVDALDSAAAKRILELTGPDTGLNCVVQINHLGGALARQSGTASAVGHRDARYAVRVLTRLSPGAGSAAVAAARADHERVFEVFGYRVLGIAPNFLLGGPVTVDQVRACYDEKDYARLVELKAAYDPENLFRGYHNIPPPSAGVR
ncbi:FAD-binding oxidoreductase [Streptomyces sp. ISL-10]|uniref:FAD-binding oxidoreductase n=1 Tax=Streptomyces sp. ISL-10 TaxID=2819172 RepID=UPI001BE6A8F2|nr:FAD-binding oxidoreductase [Streptomyces sp. ISL-10]MBT2367966.1 FAD-binding oxidoreductase [Streptomyces sp. ISL-10]